MSVEADAAWSDAGARGTLVERSPLLLAAAVAGAYFLAAWLGLGLIARPQDVAVFWPAAGVAAGSMLAMSRPTRPWLARGLSPDSGRRTPNGGRRSIRITTTSRCMG